MTKKTMIKTGAGLAGTLVTFAVIAWYLHQFGFTYMQHGELQRTQHIIELQEHINIHFQRSAMGASLAQKYDWASWGTQREMAHRWFLLAFGDSALADTLAPPPVNCGYWEPEHGQLYDRQGNIVMPWPEQEPIITREPVY